MTKKNLNEIVSTPSKILRKVPIFGFSLYFSYFYCSVYAAYACTTESHSKISHLVTLLQYFLRILIMFHYLSLKLRRQTRNVFPPPQRY